MANLYDILGVQKNASQDDIKKAYKKLAIQNHPDKGGDEKKFQEISNAYDVLGDQKKRQDYDNGGQQFRGRPNHEDIFAQMFGHKMNGMNNKNQKFNKGNINVMKSVINLETYLQNNRWTKNGI